MDPDACLKEIRELTAQILSDDITYVDYAQVADRLAELIESLDNWITNGGFLPKAWKPVMLVPETMEPFPMTQEEFDRECMLSWPLDEETIT